MALWRRAHAAVSDARGAGGHGVSRTRVQAGAHRLLVAPRKIPRRPRRRLPGASSRNGRAGG
eukprot:3879009-Alexandrium_andersonii.AAC.1